MDYLEIAEVILTGIFVARIIATVIALIVCIILYIYTSKK